jgi:serine/threonine protein kinase
LLDPGTARPVGTPLYLAPEVLAGEPASVQSDIYSLGVLLFQEAVHLDPLFAEALASLALERVRTANQARGPDRDAQYASARAEALKAIELDPALGTGFLALANIRFYRDWDWSGAEEAYAKAVELTSLPLPPDKAELEPIDGDAGLAPDTHSA